VAKLAASSKAALAAYAMTFRILKKIFNRVKKIFRILKIFFLVIFVEKVSKIIYNKYIS